MSYPQSGSAVVLQPLGAAFPQPGGSVVLAPITLIAPAGWLDDAFGSATIFIKDIEPHGWVDDVFGSVNIQGPKTLFVRTFVDDTFGASASIVNRNRTFNLGGWADDAFGTTLAIGPRTFNLTGWSSTAFGSHTIQGLGHTVRPAGIASTLAFGSHMVAWKMRFVVPAGIARPDMFEPIIGFPPFDVYQIDSMTPDGTTDSVVGANTQVTLQPVAGNISHAGGFNAGFTNGSVNFGNTNVMPFYIKPNGFTNPNGFTGPPDDVWGRAVISNKIRTINLTGYAAPTYGRPSIFYKDRFITMSGWDSALVFDDFGPIGLNGERSGGLYYGPRSLTAAGWIEEGLGTPSVS